MNKKVLLLVKNLSKVNISVKNVQNRKKTVLPNNTTMFATLKNYKLFFFLSNFFKKLTIPMTLIQKK